ncbi:MAG: S1/P1 nuclease [Alistipes sp.]|nr:S1/P1 nuclease [Alistipes sp.]
MKQAVKVLVIAIVAMMSVCNAYAWSSTGHSTVAHIADQNLTPKARKMCGKYLGHSLAYYASWLDRWRYSMEYRHTSRWHAVGIKDGKIVSGHMAGATSEGFAPLTVEEQGITRLNQLVEQLKDYKKLSDSAVVVNLKCIIHIVGDMHCPCHTLFDGTKQFNMTNRGRKTDFHTYIDGAFTRFHSRMTSDEFCHKYCRLTKKEVKELCKVSPEGWIWENADTFRECYKLLDPSKDYHDLPEQNKLRMKEITDEMLVKAGYRLANVINEIFK